jgi:hypothetical protein
MSTVSTTITAIEATAAAINATAIAEKLGLPVKRIPPFTEAELNAFIPSDSSPTLRQQLREYLHTLTDQERLACRIAADHLETSFCLEYSNGFLNWLETKNKNNE